MTDMLLDIAPIREDEHEAWLALVTAYMGFYATLRQPGDYDRLWQRLHSGAGLRSFGARVEGRLVGFTHYLFHASCWSADVCYLQDLFVAPEVRGQGIGRALIGHVTEQARQAGSPRVYWLTQAGNEAARGLYDQVATHTGFIRYEINLG